MGEKMNANLKTKFTLLASYFGRVVKVTLVLILVLTFAACTTNLQSKVAGNLNQFSKQQTVAILPVEVVK